MFPTRSGGGAPRGWLAATAVATAAMLTLVIPSQPFDTNFYSMWEGTTLLAGDRPYRDFFEWGIPLQATLSAVTQRLVGYRMIGEFILVHWPFIIAGAVISFDLGYRSSRSVAATALTAVLALAVLPDTPTFHYSKLFLYPAAIWLAWRYIERPSARAAAALGLLTAVAFLFRHDHGVYIGFASVLACALVRATVRERPWRRTLMDGAVFTAVATAVVLPWLLLVQSGEGLRDYVGTRADLYDMWAGEDAYRGILHRDPLEFTRSWTPPPPKPGVVSFQWEPGTTTERQVALERQFGLRRLEGPDADRRWQYEVDNVYAGALYDLRNRAENSQGLDWERLEALHSWVPAREPARVWLAQVTIVVPLLLLASAAWSLARHLIDHTRPSPDTLRLLLAGALLVLVDAKLFREVSYAHLVAPVTAAMSARFLKWPTRGALVGWARLAAAAPIAAACAITSVGCMDPAALFSEGNLKTIPEIFGHMVHYPPIDTEITQAEANRIMSESGYDAWLKGEIGVTSEILLRYVHDCTTDGDHVLVSGPTPFHVGYFIERPIAGGHVFWEHRWRADPKHESEMLALLERQSVPFALSTHQPVLDDLAAYPTIRQHFDARYTVLPGSRGQLLVDARRTPKSTFGPYAFPCFK